MLPVVERSDGSCSERPRSSSSSGRPGRLAAGPPREWRVFSGLRYSPRGRARSLRAVVHVRSTRLALAGVALVSPLAACAGAAPVRACAARQLAGAFAVLPASAGAGHVVYVLTLTNASHATCVVGGPPTVQLLTADGVQLPTAVRSARPGKKTDVRVTLDPGASAAAEARLSADIPGPGEPRDAPCEPLAARLRLTAAGGSTLELPIEPPTPVCEGGSLAFRAFASRPAQRARRGTVPSLFAPALAYRIHAQPHSLGADSVAIGDLDRDGIADLAVANSYSNDVSVLLGTRKGGFRAPRRYRAPIVPMSVAVADLNRDGIPDLVLAGANGVAVLLGTGDGRFHKATVVAPRTDSSSLAVGDLNGDGRPDLALSVPGSHVVAVLLGNGQGGFRSARRYRAGGQPEAVAVGDLDGDGRPDLAVADHASDTVSVLLGRGDGSFRPLRRYRAGHGPVAVAVGDLNGDGRPDLAVVLASRTSSRVAVLLGTGRGRFATARVHPVGFRSFSVAVADLDGDGVPDLAVAVIARARDAKGRVSVLLGRGDGSFETAGVYRTGVAPAALAIGDLNGDERPDIAVADEGSDDVSVLLSRRTR